MKDNLLADRCLTWAEIKAEAKGNWHLILSSAGIAEQYLREKKHAACPICQAGKDRYRYTNKNDDGCYICSQCGHGDGFALLQQICNLTSKQSLDFVANWLGLKGHDSVQPSIKSVIPEQSNNHKSDAEFRAKAEYLWKSGKYIQFGDTVDLYLRKRGIELNKYPEALRFHPKLKHILESTYERPYYSGMLAKLTAPDGTFGGLLRTYLLQTGVKAFAESKRFMRGAISPGSAVRLYEPTNVLGISEGIETALACHLATGIPVWATTGTAFMEKIIIPTQVTEVVIFADHDKHEAGLKSAHVLARRLMKEGRTVKVLMPSEPGCDWADVALASDDQVEVR